MFLFDSHVHFFSHDFFTALIRQKDPAANLEEELAKLAAAAGLELPGRRVSVHLKRWLEEFDRHGVDRAVIFASLPEEIVAVGEALALAAGRLAGYFLINPRNGGSVELVHKLSEQLGYRGVLLFPALHHYHLYDETLLPFFEAVAQRRLNVLVHCGMLQIKLRDLLGLPRVYESRFAQPLDLQPVANRFRQTAFIIPHFGAGLFRETLLLGAQCENVYVDTSSSNAWIATQPATLTLAEVFHRSRAVFGAERLLFGSDSGVFPRGWRRDLFQAQQLAMRQAGFSESEMALVFGENLRRLLEG
ncbi:MAG: amidohydrolase family protein [candidate division KSB1 bacterium]|nr:amidohydrolase family protein [candidate division KSB1 bacterium]MDZ7273192.1 amidohydrolase family protein [candidate division KSB1 bacterium]MDZ7285294.1 amidohydrolase family protein [candidate division KSB1 bacterium]MDZ7298326.1 amidohydrolase family protein [candidate division KSB1 bacterium]MDZ7349041.1 amidohydrolase family protein [candidate division KSB1 bacterium]